MGKSRRTAVDLDYKKLREGVISLNCQSCGAPIKKCKYECGYCGTMFAKETVQYLRQLGKIHIEMHKHPAPYPPPESLLACAW